MKLHALLPMLSALLITLSGCSSQPSTLILNPLLPTVSAAQVAPLPVQFTSQDVRPHRHAAELRHTNGSIQNVALSNSPTLVLENAFAHGLSSMGYQLSDDADAPQLLLTLDEMLVVVDQHRLTHEAISLTAITIVVRYPHQELSKRFVAKGKFTGTFTADAPRIERELNDRIAQLIKASLADVELHQFIQQQAAVHQGGHR
ncbi:MAG: YajG family lipoprotein [Ferrimonas sp.]